MPHPTANAAAADEPAPRRASGANLIREVKLAGQTYRLRPLAVADHEEIMRWAQDRILEIARRAAEGLPSAERIELLQGAIATASRLTLTSPDTLRLLGSIDGATRMLWMSLRGEHPELDQAAIVNLLLDPQTLVDTVAEMKRLNEEAEAIDVAGRKTIDS